MHPFSEVRQDIVTGDWVVIAIGRAKRPHDFLSQSREIFREPQSECPFEELKKDALAAYELDGKETEISSNWFWRFFVFLLA